MGISNIQKRGAASALRVSGRKFPVLMSHTSVMRLSYGSSLEPTRGKELNSLNLLIPTSPPLLPYFPNSTLSRVHSLSSSPQKNSHVGTWLRGQGSIVCRRFAEPRWYGVWPSPFPNPAQQSVAGDTNVPSVSWMQKMA